MSPDQVTAISTLIGILSKLSSWPLGMLIFAMVVGPWVFALALAQQYRRGLDETRQMYKNNAHLVESYETLAKDLKDVVIMNTQAFTRASNDIEGNQFCPMVRLKKKAAGVIDG